MKVIIKLLVRTVMKERISVNSQFDVIDPLV